MRCLLLLEISMFCLQTDCWQETQQEKGVASKSSAPFRGAFLSNSSVCKQRREIARNCEEPSCIGHQRSKEDSKSTYVGPGRGQQEGENEHHTPGDPQGVGGSLFPTPFLSRRSPHSCSRTLQSEVQNRSYSRAHYQVFCTPNIGMYDG